MELLTIMELLQVIKTAKKESKDSAEPDKIIFRGKEYPIVGLNLKELQILILRSGIVEYCLSRIPKCMEGQLISLAALFKN